MSIPDSERCTAKVADFTGFHWKRCANRAKYGAHCGVHCPEKQAERQKRRPTKFDRDMLAASTRRDARVEYDAALDEVLREARALARRTEWGRAADLHRALERFDNLTKEKDDAPEDG